VSDGTGFRLQVVDGEGDEFAIVESSGGSALADTGLRTDTRGVSARLQVRQDIQDKTFLVSRGALQSNSFSSSAVTSDTTDFTTLGLTVPGTLTFTVDGSTTATVNYTGADTLQSVATSINNDSTLASANISAEVIVEGSNYRLKINDADSNNFWIDDSGGATGLNVATSQGVTIGDGSVATDLAAAFAQTVTFNAAPQSGGGLARTDATFTDYASTILSFNATAQTANNRDLDAQTSLTDELFNKNASISGVNLDEELASMVIYQQAYIAAARLITTTQQLFQVLDDTVSSIG
jgi:flagellar hook-associated protein 1 FlgK